MTTDEVAVTCDCGKQLKVPFSALDRRAKCSHCGNIFVPSARLKVEMKEKEKFNEAWRQQKFPRHLPAQTSARDKKTTMWLGVAGGVGALIILGIFLSAVGVTPKKREDESRKAFMGLEKDEFVKYARKIMPQMFKSAGNPDGMVLRMNQEGSALYVVMDMQDWTDAGAAAMKDFVHAVTSAFYKFREKRNVSTIFKNRIGRVIAEGQTSWGEIKVGLK